MGSSFDKRLSEIWNETHNNDKISPEHMWDICRMLCDLELLQYNIGAVSAIKIGPFNIATNLTATNEEALLFFIESLFPIIIMGISSDISFNDAYQLYIIPIVKLFIHLLKNSFFIKDKNVWKTVVYVKMQNQINVFPTFSDLNNKFIQDGINADPKEIISKCLKLKNNLGEPKPILMIDSDNRIHSLV